MQATQFPNQNANLDGGQGRTLVVIITAERAFPSLITCLIYEMVVATMGIAE